LEFELLFGKARYARIKECLSISYRASKQKHKLVSFIAPSRHEIVLTQSILEQLSDALENEIASDVTVSAIDPLKSSISNMASTKDRPSDRERVIQRSISLSKLERSPTPVKTSFVCDGEWLKPSNACNCAVTLRRST